MIDKKTLKKIADRLLYKDFKKYKVVTYGEKISYNAGVMDLADKINELLND